MKSNQFERYVNLIRKQAHFYAKRYGIEYEEVEAQGFLIYCQCLENYDVSRSEFSTHLSWELKRLNDFCKTYLRQRGNLIEDYFAQSADPDLSVIDIIPSYGDNPTLSDLLAEGFKNLSSKAYRIFEWILSRDWERKGRRRPSVTTVADVFHCTRKEAVKFWNEIGDFYRSNLCAV